MSEAFADPISIELRAGPDCCVWGDPYRARCLLTVQADRTAYMSSIVAEGTKLYHGDVRALIRCAQAMAAQFGYTELFSRKFVRDKQTGKKREHIWRIPLQSDSEVYLDAGIPSMG